MKKVGILTFHCSDNYGAMLQAYGLKTYLCSQGFDAEIINYCPPFLTGRHWLFPYVPQGGFLKTARYAVNTFRRRNMREMDVIREQRKNMRMFRSEYLSNGRKRYFLPQLRGLKYGAYVLGSDQIWNPELTYGLRPAYFGLLPGIRASGGKKPSVISYAASFGGSRIEDKYRGVFTKYLQNLDAVSVREASAVPFVQEMCKREVSSVPDPVFLPERTLWEKIAGKPRELPKSGYIFCFAIEERRDIREYVSKLSQEKGLPVVEVRYRKAKKATSENVIYTAGPSEFLCVLKNADYVVTNSFHAAAFSIIFEKQFAVFAYTGRSARLFDMLDAAGLSMRVCEGEDFDIDAVIDWTDVRAKTELFRKRGTDFLSRHLDNEKVEADNV